ncbi:hypothetical protein [Nocardia lasii]|uniref:Uncharacterized protein n=1 Tax=Nocardia lasii TaxID=1616107 RepID=A0ABW1JVK8_9NOCA
MSTHTGYSDGVTLDYDAPRYDNGAAIGAYVRLKVASGLGSYSLSLSIDEARVLAEQLPVLVMAHDAAEHIAKGCGAAEFKAA